MMGLFHRAGYYLDHNPSKADKSPNDDGIESSLIDYYASNVIELKKIRLLNEVWDLDPVKLIIMET